MVEWYHIGLITRGLDVRIVSPQQRDEVLTARDRRRPEDLFFCRTRIQSGDADTDASGSSGMLRKRARPCADGVRAIRMSTQLRGGSSTRGIVTGSRCNALPTTLQIRTCGGSDTNSVVHVRFARKVHTQRRTGSNCWTSTPTAVPTAASKARCTLTTRSRSDVADRATSRTSVLPARPATYTSTSSPRTSTGRDAALKDSMYARASCLGAPGSRSLRAPSPHRP